MTWIQRTLHLPAHSRGFHLITREVVAALPELSAIEVGLLHVFLQHTSASLTINENADSDVPARPRIRRSRPSRQRIFPTATRSKGRTTCRPM